MNPRPLEASASSLTQAAVPASEAAAAGRRVFDGEALRGALPVAAGLPSAPAPLPAPTPVAARALALVPAAAPLAAAPSGGGWAVVFVVAGLALLVAAQRALSRPARPEPLPYEPLPPASASLDAVREQVAALAEELAASCAAERKPETITAALSARWRRALSEGGVRLRRPDGTIREVSVRPEVFAAIDLPSILASVSRRGGERYYDALSDVLRGLPLEAARAATVEEAYERLAWWKAHFARFPG